MDFTSCHFWIPDTDAFVSGGNLYNANLISELSAKGISISQSSERPVVHCEWIWTDSLFLDQGRVVQDLSRSHKLGMIVHHLSSLETDAPKLSAREYGVLKMFDRLIATSQFMANYLSSRIDSRKISVIHPGITRDSKDLVSGKLQNVLLVANLIPRKGILEFLGEWMTNGLYKEMALTIVGSTDMDPEYAQECREIIASTKLSKPISLTGQVEHSQIWKYYSNADAFVSVASMETFGMAIQEAIAKKVPVICLDRGGISEHVKSGQDGWLFADRKAMLDFLEKYAGAQLPDLQQRKRSSNRWSDVAEQFIQLNRTS